MTIRQQAFEGEGRFLKGGLHCHTTRSDGQGNPDEVILRHVQMGYDFLALTDHRIYNFQNFAPETNLTILPGMEFDNTFVENKGFRTFHTVCLGPPEGENGYSQDQKFDSGTAKNQEEYQAYLDVFHENNNLTFYCHPQWSSTPARYFDKLEGDFAMEIWNSGCALSCDMDTNAAYWDELLGMGKKLYGVATDDGHPMERHGNGWVMVKSENNIRAILDALQAGRFYSSCGPKLFDFYVENGVAHVQASPVAQIQFLADKHPTAVRKNEDGSLLTEASLDLKNNYAYIRACVVDQNGRRAWSNPIFL